MVGHLVNLTNTRKWLSLPQTSAKRCCLKLFAWFRATLPHPAALPRVCSCSLWFARLPPGPRLPPPQCLCLGSGSFQSDVRSSLPTNVPEEYSWQRASRIPSGKERARKPISIVRAFPVMSEEHLGPPGTNLCLEVGGCVAKPQVQ